MEHPNNLLACRTAARLSQMKVAAALEVSQSEYSRMELGDDKSALMLIN